MVALYCRHKLGADEMPEDYKELCDYACRRLDHCRFGGDKPACKKCPVHCYAPKRREQMREVMRWTGPRMLFYSPVAAIRHLLSI